ncbi:hypothetical protein BSU04_04220 [Caballeronia sordidicola]|uniref:Uncharacterized protein n=1 Tax=Caballeronia sordidicola TaxID=196367 RepID=A0A226X955_CABSO|nr:hypothetical protein BSU04_04220 [Caballeronia sordidicola]
MSAFCNLSGYPDAMCFIHHAACQAAAGSAANYVQGLFLLL